MTIAQATPHRHECHSNKGSWENQRTPKTFNMVENGADHRSGRATPDWDQQVQDDQHGSESTCTRTTGWRHGKACHSTTCQLKLNKKEHQEETDLNNSLGLKPTLSADCNRNKTTKPLQLDFNSWVNNDFRLTEENSTWSLRQLL